ncbi:hypothetical protein Vadar_008315 [Vaccinium darrowii]|uniref:Uncharacterized protein n=1 Tax=Vaccinium darrowii TaxID=229202 RepID=A0ACB7X8K2_9ERIC|nr:hypothetical protein Vadar_008315 [Vaccinium darrowii]
MGWKIWLEKKQLLTSATLIQPFYLLTTTLLSLLLPLSFLLLARLSASYAVFTSDPYPQPHPSNYSSILISLFIKTNPSFLHAVVSLLTAATLIHGLTGQKLVTTESPDPNFRPHLCISWILLCTLQLCIGFGIEGIIAAGIDGYGFGNERSLSSRVVFFLGLHEAMLYWWRVVVKPVVDDTVFGFVTEEKWVERAAMGVGYGALWCWRLRSEVESLAVMVEVKREMEMGVDIADFVGWWLYYLIVTIGMVRIVKGIAWVGVILLSGRVEANPIDIDYTENEDKV